MSESVPTDQLGRAKDGSLRIPGVSKALDIVSKLLTALAAIAVLVLIGVVLYQIAARSLVGRSSSWAGDLSQVALIWTTLLGSAAMLRSGEHLTVTLVTEKLPRKAQTVVQVLSDIAITILMAVLLYASVELIRQSQQSSIVGLGIGVSWKYFPLAILAATGLIFALEDAAARILHAGTKRER